MLGNTNAKIGGGSGGKVLGEIINSIIPLSNANLHLLDGNVLTKTLFPDFYDYIESLYNSNDIPDYFAKETSETSYTTVGSPVIDATQIATFSTAIKQYILSTISFISHTYNWEVFCKFKVSDLSHQNFFLSKGFVGAESNYSFLVGVNTSGQINIYLSSNGFSWDIAANYTSTKTLLIDTWYYLRIKFTGTQYLYDISTDGETWDNFITITNSLPIYNNDYKLMLGGNPYQYGSSEDLSGYIDLTKTYFNIDNRTFWLGAFISDNAEDTWQYIKLMKGCCDKFVYDSVSETVRLPYMDYMLENNNIKSYVEGSSYVNTTRIYSYIVVKE